MKIPVAPRILLAAGLCVAGLIGLVVREGLARAGGQEVRLAMEAVDPRSLLHGHYVLLNLTQRLEPGAPCPPGEQANEWLALRRDGAAHVLAGAGGSTDAALRHGPIPLRGSFTCMTGEGERPGWVQIDIGVERFHINQDDALAIERILREQQPDEETRAFAIVSVGRDGRARLKGLEIDGERLDLNWF